MRKTWLVLGKQIWWLLLPLSSFAPLLCLYSCKYDSVIFNSLKEMSGLVLLGTREFACVCFPECTCEVFHGSRTRNKLRLAFAAAESWQSLELGCVCWVLLLWTRCCSSAGPVSWLLHFTGGSGVDFPAELFSMRLKSSALGNPNPQEPEGSWGQQVWELPQPPAEWAGELHPALVGSRHSLHLPFSDLLCLTALTLRQESWGSSLCTHWKAEGYKWVAFAGGRSEVPVRKSWHHISSEKEAKQIVWK